MRKIYCLVIAAILGAGCTDSSDGSSSSITEVGDAPTDSSEVDLSSNRHSSTTVSSASISSSSVQESSSSYRRWITNHLLDELIDFDVPVCRGFSWYGYAHDTVVVGCNNDIPEESRYWFPVDDNSDGGKSKVIFHDGMEYTKENYVSIIETCEGFCADFVLNQDTLPYKPYVGAAFYVAGTDADGQPILADVSRAGGICITYTSTASAVLELGFNDEIDEAIGYDYPYVYLPKRETAQEVCTSWAGFKQAGWGKAKVTGDDASLNLSTIRFKIQQADSTTGSFNVIAVSGLPCCADPPH